MKGIEKLTSVRLAEILTERSIVPGEAISDALYAQERHGEPFAEVLINGGHITEWDLSKIVAESFNLPFLMAGNYQIEDEAKERLPQEVQFKHMLVPLDVFDDIVTVSMPVIMPFEQIMKVQKAHSCEIFPYVGLISENKRILGDMHDGYHKWLDEETQRRVTAAKQRESNPTAGGENDWMSIFDAGDQAIKATKE